MKSVVISALKEALSKLNVAISEKDLEFHIEIPPSIDKGDFAFPCFFLAGRLREDPKKIALKVKEALGEAKSFEKISAEGPYVNFFLDRKGEAKSALFKVLNEKDSYGRSEIGANTKTMVEFPSPNTNKPLHLGHLRNMSIGESVSRILEFSNERVIRSNLNNDRGIHICKSMLAYRKWGKNKKPSKKLKSDHLVGDFYVLFAKNAALDKTLEEEAQNMLLKWEAGERKTIGLANKMNAWALKGFKETYKKFGIKHDKEYYESKLYTKGKEMIYDGLNKGIFSKEEDGSIVADLSKEGLGKKHLLRADGTSIYITQDIYLAKLKFDEHKIMKSIYVVGNEQDHHFRVLFSILDKLNLAKKENLHHLSYGMVNLPEGKMKSREGNVVDADDLISEVRNLVKWQLDSKSKLKKLELDKRSLKIALAAIKYMLLKIDTRKEMMFNPKESISFEGDTGPYLLYSYARASSILKKSKKKQKLEFDSLEEKEIELAKKISQFPDVVSSSYKSLNPSLIANYSYQLSQTFNEFYHAYPVLDSEKEPFRLFLVAAFRQTLKRAINRIDNCM